MSYESYVPLACIRPNPWQPRETVNQEEIQKLAQSIQEIGLLQPPVARKADENTYELAFGHRRLAAYQYLLSLEPAPATIIAAVPSKWAMMPLVVQPLTDEEMFRYAVSENVKRQDLNPLEEARAMARYRDEFGRTSAEIGELFGLSDSAVRNKIRLLQLPEDVQKAVTERQVSERVLRELTTLYSMPESVRERATKMIPAWHKNILPEEITRQALNGATAEEIHGMVERMMEYVTTRMDSALFKHDRKLEGQAFRSPACKDCSYRLVQQNGTYCGDKSCFDAKQKVSMREYLERASQACGIPVHENPMARNDVTMFWSTDKAKRIQATGCENLRLIYAHHEEHQVKGYPHAEIVCIKRSGQCVCQRMIDKGADIVQIQQQTEPAAPHGKPLVEVFGLGNEAAPGPSQQPSSGNGETLVEQPQGKTLMEVFEETTRTAAPAMTRIAHHPLTAEELHELDRKMRTQRRKNVEECKRIQQAATERIHQGLEELNRSIWFEVVRKMVGYIKRVDELKDQPVREMWLALAEKIARDLYDWSYREPDPQDALRVYNTLLKKAELPAIESALETVSAETEEEG